MLHQKNAEFGLAILPRITGPTDKIYLIFSLQKWWSCITN